MPALNALIKEYVNDASFSVPESENGRGRTGTVISVDLFYQCHLLGVCMLSRHVEEADASRSLPLLVVGNRSAIKICSWQSDAALEHHRQIWIRGSEIARHNL